ncbi:hypothetical protein JG688_00010240 [Phytophthora aleatoria]|uniref:Uncharacterized protein n=1 Tax=Phytophthora aleatoria TaxID=2496075 RepID=A0A8J5J580_9STRA|nr:hypothetical protein JG688_00010240 [Phytophthora aleatoria]
MNEMYIRRRRQPLVTNAKAISVSPKLCLSCRVEEIQHRIFKICDEWNKLMGGVNYHIRQPMIVTDSNAQKTDADGDILMPKDAVELLGQELVRRLRITRIRRRCSASSASGQPQRKRPALETQRSTSSLVVAPTNGFRWCDC